MGGGLVGGKGEEWPALTEAAEAVVLCVVLALLNVVPPHDLHNLCVLVNKADLFEQLLLVELELADHSPRLRCWMCVCWCDFEHVCDPNH